VKEQHLQLATLEGVEERMVEVGVLQQSLDHSKLSQLCGTVLHTVAVLSMSESRTSPSPHGSYPFKTNTKGKMKKVKKTLDLVFHCFQLLYTAE
jgi:hypothetical protein